MIPARDGARVRPLPATAAKRLRVQPAPQSVARHPFALVPTHAVGVAEERRVSARAYLQLPLRLVGVAGRREAAVTLVTRNISSSGVFFLSPRHIEPGTPIELEVGLIDRPFGRGSVRMATAARVVRVERASAPGWHGIAAAFDEFDFCRDESLPTRYQKP